MLLKWGDGALVLPIVKSVRCWERRQHISIFRFRTCFIGDVKFVNFKRRNVPSQAGLWRVGPPFLCSWKFAHLQPLAPPGHHIQFHGVPMTPSEVCLRPGSVAESPHVHFSCAKTDLCLSKIPFKSVLLPNNMTTSALHLFPIQKRTASAIPLLLAAALKGPTPPFDGALVLPIVKSVRCWERRQHINIYISFKSFNI